MISPEIAAKIVGHYLLPSISSTTKTNDIGIGQGILGELKWFVQMNDQLKEAKEKQNEEKLISEKYK